LSRPQSLEYIIGFSLWRFYDLFLSLPHFCNPQMASNAQCPGYNIPLSQPTRLEALHSRLKGVTPDPTRRRDDLRVSEPIQDDTVREVRDDWDSSDGVDVAESSDRSSDGTEVNNLDVGGLLEEYVWCRRARNRDENDAKNSTGSTRGSSTSQAYLLSWTLELQGLTIDYRALESSMEEQERWNKEVIRL